MNLMTSVMPRKRCKQILKIPDTLLCGGKVVSIFSMYVVSDERVVIPTFLP